ncbi:hypothetical protein GJ496_003316 [Pomphorhynchus laevis]|nr:hypothetical protein GJ496_003316 [Pomphorhynchus laevis]
MESKANLPNQPVRLSERIKNMMDSRQPWFALEFSQPGNSSHLEKLIPVFDYFLSSHPLFYSITTSNNCKLANEETKLLERDNQYVNLANIMVNFCGLDTLLHVISSGSRSKEAIRKYLRAAINIGIKNVLVTFVEENSVCEDVQGFTSLADVVQFIKQEFTGDDSFGIGVLGYQSSLKNDYDQSLVILHEAVQNGADFVLSNVVIDTTSFVKFVRDCRCCGIKCPIVAHIDPLALIDARVSNSEQRFNPDVHNDQSVEFMNVVAKCVTICEQIIRSGLITGFYFVTHNQRNCTDSILKKLHFWPNKKPKRQMPWRQSAKTQRFYNESVRPIFWSARVKSYLHKTSSWEQFPNGRWNNMNITSLSNVTDHQLAYHHWNVSNATLLNQWGHDLSSEREVWDVFVSFLQKSKNPKTDCLVELFPWCEEVYLAEETNVIIDDLIKVNKRGVLTINSQPNVNGIPSDDPVYGWGPIDGYIYQKAYLEFFIPTKMIGSLLTILRQYPRVSFHIVNKKDQDDINNHEEGHSIAVTWGVFPGREVLQPTVVDSLSFRIWKNEAYNIWTKRWGILYNKNSESYKLLEYITENYSLVNIVDNDYPKHNCLFELIEKVFAYENREYNVQQIFAV